MEELVKLIKGLDDEKKKKLFSELCNANTVEGVMSVGNNYNLNITKEIAMKMYEELKSAKKLSNEELEKLAAGSSEPDRCVYLMLINPPHPNCFWPV